MDAHAARLTCRLKMPVPAGGAWLQRKCACGTHAGGVECTNCSRKRLQRMADPVCATATATNALSQEGADGRFGWDFSDVPMSVAAGITIDDVDSPRKQGSAHATEPVPHGQLVQPQQRRAPMLRRQPKDGGAAPPKNADESSPDSNDGGALANAATAASVCNPTGMKRVDFLKQPNVTTNDFGLTRLDVSAVTFPTVVVKRVKGKGFAIEPTTAALPTIPSVFTGADVFEEGEAHFINQEGGECPSGKKPIRWVITTGGAAKIKQGEQEHCDDFQFAFDLSLKRYVDAVNALAGKPVYASQVAAEKALAKATGVAPADLANVFICLSRKTMLRDKNQWHTPKPLMREPKIATDCAFVTAFVFESSLKEIGRHSSAEIIKDCGERGKQADAGAPGASPREASHGHPR